MEFPSHDCCLIIFKFVSMCFLLVISILSPMWLFCGFGDKINGCGSPSYPLVAVHAASDCFWLHFLSLNAFGTCWVTTSSNPLVSPFHFMQSAQSTAITVICIALNASGISLVECLAVFSG